MQFSLFNYKTNGSQKLVASIMLSVLLVINAHAQSNIYPAESDAKITNGKLLLQRSGGSLEKLTFKDISYPFPLEFGLGTYSDGLYLTENGTLRYHFRSGGDFILTGKLAIGTALGEYPSPDTRVLIEKNSASIPFIALRDKTYSSTNPEYYYFTGDSGGLYVKHAGSTINLQFKKNAGIQINKTSGNSESLLTLQDTRSTVGLSYDFSTDADGLKIKQGQSLYHFKNDGKFIVAGPIHAREVMISLEAGGSDFVFNDNYPLPSIDEVEKFIKANKHLPDVASAREMETNGIELGKMDMKLLQKVEELTLYIIDLQKQINQVKEENGQLKGEVNKLKERQR